MDEDLEAGPSVLPSGSGSKLEEKKSEEKKPEEKKPDKKKPEEKKPKAKKPKQGSSSGISPRASGSRTVVKWNRSNFCDCNCLYLLRIRGIMNIIHIGLSVALIILLGHACQLRPANNQPSEGFFCKPPEVFLFTTSCAAFYNSILLLLCCIFSKRTDNMLFQTSLEISYYILYFVLFLAASITLLISIINWGSDRIFFNSDYATLQTIAIIGLVTACCYGISTLWFFISQQFYTSEIVIENNEVIDNQTVVNKSNENQKQN